MIQASCPHCGHSFRIPEEDAGMAVACKQCGQSFLTLADVPTAPGAARRVDVQLGPARPAAGDTAPLAASDASGDLSIQLGQAHPVKPEAAAPDISLQPAEPPQRCGECGGVIQMGLCTICGRGGGQEANRLRAMLLLILGLLAAGAGGVSWFFLLQAHGAITEAIGLLAAVLGGIGLLCAIAGAVLLILRR